MMSVLLSHAGQLYLGVNYDTAAVTDGDLLDRSLESGFAEVLKCGTGRRRAVDGANKEAPVG
jgi:hypothetical protein